LFDCPYVEGAAGLSELAKLGLKGGESFVADRGRQFGVDAGAGELVLLHAIDAAERGCERDELEDASAGVGQRGRSAQRGGGGHVERDPAEREFRLDHPRAS